MRSARSPWIQACALVTLHALVTTAIDLKSASTLEHVIITSLEGAPAAQTPTPRVDGTLAFAELVTGEGRPPVTRVPIHADDGGVGKIMVETTGSPKGAMLTHRNIFANVVQTETFTYASLASAANRRYMIVLPYAHVFGFTVGLMKGPGRRAAGPGSQVRCRGGARSGARLPADPFPRCADGVDCVAVAPAHHRVRPRSRASSRAGCAVSA